MGEKPLAHPMSVSPQLHAQASLACTLGLYRSNKKASRSNRDALN